MKRQAIALIINKQSERQTLLSVGFVLTAISSNAWLMAGAQSINQDSCLPPEVIPVSAAVKYTANPAANNISTTPIPGIVSPAVQSEAAQPAFQSAQEARQSLFNSLMGTNVYPQFSGGNGPFNQAGNMAGIQNLSQGTAQTLSNNPALCNDPALNNNSVGQSNLITPGQFNSNFNGNTVNASSNQTQTLTGSTSTPSTSQPRTSGGIGRLGGLAAGVGLMGVSFANSGGGNIYSNGLLGASLLNYGVRNGFNF